MDAKALLADPTCCPSVARAALRRLLGEAAPAWEPEALRLELARRGVAPRDGLLAKLLGAQVVATTSAWATDHDALFAFALACDDVPAASGTLHHPTPAQLAWAVREVAALRGAAPDDDEGFDPDAVDPAIAAVLHDEGWVVAPAELAFAQAALDRLGRGEPELAHAVRAAWDALRDLTLDGLRRKAEGLREDAEGVQLRRLADCRLEVAERERRRAQHHAALGAGA